MISLVVAAQLMANPCMIVHTHKSHHAPQQSAICPVMPPCGKEATNVNITPIDPVPYGYMYVSDVSQTALLAPITTEGSPSIIYPVGGLPTPVYPSPVKVQQTPELETEGYFAAATLLLLALLCTLTKRRES
jgi:hypothetical protein